ncbi:MAG: FAD-dependent oxidoreductase [Isosphaeraceae bacterium]
MFSESYWNVGPNLPRFPRLDENLKVDVVVVGGGITGVTTAYLLAKEGFSVALLERDRCGGVDTGHTTAHLTAVTDQRLNELVKRFGRDQARAVWHAGAVAIDEIEAIVRQEGIDCEFRRVPGYLHAPIGGKSAEGLVEDAELGREFGFEAEYLESVPFAGTPGVRFENQAKFHPLKYLAGILERLPVLKCHVFERSEVIEVQDEPLAVKANGRTITCAYLVIATHVPLAGNVGMLGAALFQTKLASYSSYVVGAKVKRGTVPEALFWDTSDPYRYLRADAYPSRDFVIFGGEDHKTGQDDPETRFVALERRLGEILPEAEVTHRWSGQVVETNDGLPFIGEMAEKQFAATGFAGNGMTFGTLAAVMARDAVTGRENPWAALFDPNRKKILGGTWDYIRENLDYPYHMIKDRLARSEDATTQDLKPGMGKILTLDGQRVAAYRDESGNLFTRSPYCPHLGCLVSWNSAESTWDCPCHGSRFKPTGQVLAGPAESPLEEVVAKV